MRILLLVVVITVTVRTGVSVIRMHRRRRQGTHGQWSPYFCLFLGRFCSNTSQTIDMHMQPVHHEEEAPIAEDGDGGEDIRAEVDLTRDIVGWTKSCITLSTLNYGNYGIFLIMGSAGFCPSAVPLPDVKGNCLTFWAI